MQAYNRRRKKWEHWENQNHQQLLSLIEVSQDIGQKNVAAAARFISFLLYLAYGGSRWLMGLLRVLIVYPNGVHNQLAEAERRRLELNSHPSLWLK